MAFKFRRTATLAKIESVYGTDSTPTGEANAMLITDVSIDPVRSTKINRDLQLPAAGQDLTLLAGLHVQFACKAELAASGEAGVAPKWGVLARACGLAQTIVAETSVEYDPVSASEESAALYFYADGGMHKLTGMRGNMRVEFTKLGLAYLAFDFLGIYNPVSSSAFPGTVTLTGWEKPKPLSKANTPTASLHSHAVKMPALTLDLGQQLDYRDYANQQEVVIADRSPNGSITIETPDPATKNYFTNVVAETVGALQVVHGVGAGKIVTIDCPYVQLTDPRRVNDNNTSMMQLALGLTRSAGDDEFKITLT